MRGLLAFIIEGDPSLRAAQDSPRERAVALYSQKWWEHSCGLRADRVLADEILPATRSDP